VERILDIIYPSREGFLHDCVNHSINFVDPIRKRLSRGGIKAEYLADHLCEFLWRRDCEQRIRDPFLHMIEIIKQLYPV